MTREPKTPPLERLPNPEKARADLYTFTLGQAKKKHGREAFVDTNAAGSLNVPETKHRFAPYSVEELAAEAYLSLESELRDAIETLPVGVVIYRAGVMMKRHLAAARANVSSRLSGNYRPKDFKQGTTTPSKRWAEEKRGLDELRHERDAYIEQYTGGRAVNTANLEDEEMHSGSPADNIESIGSLYRPGKWGTRDVKGAKVAKGPQFRTTSTAADYIEALERGELEAFIRRDSELILEANRRENEKARKRRLARERKRRQREREKNQKK